MKIEKILNNNVIIYLDENNQETIAMGKGLGFQKKPGDDYDEALVEKVFKLDQVHFAHVEELLRSLPSVYFEIADEICKEAKIRNASFLDDLSYIGLVDHIYGTCERAKNGVYLTNAINYEVKRFYRDEYDLGEYALTLIRNRLGITLKDDEAGFIALHFVSNASDNPKEMYEITEVMQEVCNIIRRYFGMELDDNSIYYYRFINHLRYFAERLIKKQAYEGKDDELLDIIRVKYQNAFSCTETISEFILKRYDYKLSDEEKLYLTIHIHRIIYKS